MSLGAEVRRSLVRRRVGSSWPRPRTKIWRKVSPARATVCSWTRGVLYLRVGTSSSMVRQAERGSAATSWRSVAVRALPEVDEAEDFFGLLALADVGIGVAEGPSLGILGKKGQDTGLAAATHRDVMALEYRVVAGVRDGVEIEVEGIAGKEVLPFHELMPGGEQTGILGGVDTRGILGKKALLWNGVESCEQGQAFVGHQGHDMAAAFDAPELECKASAQGVLGGDHPGTRQASSAGQLVQLQANQVRHEEE